MKATSPAPSEAQTASAFRNFNTAVIVSVMLATLGFVIFNYEVNLYGLFGDVRGKEFPVWGTERTAKYLMTYNYIPANFDSALFGTSISANWNTSKITAARVYNCSVSGGNISEEHLLAESIFARRRLKLAVVVIYPYLTESFGRKSAFMDPHEYWSALGSLQLLNAYRERMGFGRHEITAFGQERFLPVDRGQPRVTVMPLDTDSRALQEYADFVRQVESKSDHVVAVIPLVPRRVLLASQPGLGAYNQRAISFFDSRDFIIDLNTCPELAAVSEDESAFPDGTHYSAETAEKVSSVLSSRISQRLLASQ